jgi:hypothetical protein
LKEHRLASDEPTLRKYATREFARPCHARAPVPLYAIVIYDVGIRAKRASAVKRANEKSCVEIRSFMSLPRRPGVSSECFASANVTAQRLDFTRKTRSFRVYNPRPCAGRGRCGKRRVLFPGRERRCPLAKVRSSLLECGNADLRISMHNLRVSARVSAQGFRSRAQGLPGVRPGEFQKACHRGWVSTQRVRLVRDRLQRWGEAGHQ